ncbi:metalloregulator ArsR/SmtB family transcription factor [Paraferrimonas sp. SM1919]|uniref:ArsR/SmtB family transcription factor n=1 Tax=Paraferrimonas sp. SM1919 TaxID=2662263 RepID=UPI0013D76231|nr:metalloregulator ArsR/SmtB family transcription factor [Paraferrimonas sp. SM1919]
MDNLTIDAMLDNAGLASKLLKAMANPYRLVLLCLLLKNEMSVSKLNDEVDLSQSALSQHLAVLRKEGLVSTRKEAQVVYYQLASPLVVELISTMHQHFCAMPTTAE